MTMPDYPLPELTAQQRLAAAAPALLDVCVDLVESAEYWSEYDVPLGIVDRLNAAIAKAGGPALRTQDRCQWERTKYLWETSCDQIFDLQAILDGVPAGYTPFCFYCGRPITEIAP